MVEEDQCLAIKMKKLFISTGEVSGDLHGGLLAEALFNEAKKQSLDLRISGVGGRRMREAGVKVLADTTAISAIGIWEALPLIFPTIRIQRMVKQVLRNNPPDGIILIDYMGPNINIGNNLKSKKVKFPIIYYIAPQEWAWQIGDNKTTDLITFTNKIFAIFKLEERFYLNRGGDVSFIGHPMIDLVKKLPSQSESRSILQLNKSKKILLVLPASRPQELRYLMPCFLRSAKKNPER